MFCPTFKGVPITYLLAQGIPLWRYLRSNQNGHAWLKMVTGIAYTTVVLVTGVVHSTVVMVSIVLVTAVLHKVVILVTGVVYIMVTGVVYIIVILVVTGVVHITVVMVTVVMVTCQPAQLYDAKPQMRDHSSSRPPLLLLLLLLLLLKSFLSHFRVNEPLSTNPESFETTFTSRLLGSPLKRGSSVPVASYTAVHLYWSLVSQQYT